MKDIILISKGIILTSKRQKRELWYLLGAFVVANGCNIGAIISYEAPTTELYTSIKYVLYFTAFLYAVSVAVRLVWAIARLLFRKKKTNN